MKNKIDLDKQLLNLIKTMDQTLDHDNLSISLQNNFLGKIDWRFLLPLSSSEPLNHLVLIGGRQELADLIIKVNFAKQVSLEIPQERCADALIILFDAQVPLESAVSCLKNGGVLYYEREKKWAEVPNTSPNKTAQFLEKQGFLNLVSFWVIPSFEACKMYMPINSLEPISWYIKTSFITRSPLQLLLLLFLRLALRLNINFLMYLVPNFAITAIYNPFLAETKSILALHDQAFGSEYEGLNIYPLVLTRRGTSDLYRRIIVLPFIKGVKEPFAALKFWRTSERNINSKNEQETLTKLRNYLGSDLNESVPKALGLYDHQSVIINIESCVSGCLSTTILSRWDISIQEKLGVLEKVFYWLTEFHRCTQYEVVDWSDSEHQESIESLIKKYKQNFKVTSAEILLFEAVSEHSQSLKGVSLPLVWQHCDFNPGNIYILSNEVFVIDWASGLTLGYPLTDAFYFVNCWLKEVFHGDNISSEIDRFSKVFSRNYMDGLVEKKILLCFEEYMKNLEINPKFYSIILVQTYLSYALYKFERGKKKRSENIFAQYVNELGKNVKSIFC